MPQHVPGILLADEGPLSEAGVGLSVAPNPSRGAATLTVEMPEAARGRLAVCDVLGREMLVVADRPFLAGVQTLALGRVLPAGAYVARLATAKGTTAIRFTVVR